MRYEWKHVKPDENGGFDVEGRVVHAHPHTRDPKRGFYVLVEVGENRDSDIPLTFEDDSERVADNSENPPTCSGTKSDGSPCTREVDNPGDRCWQHPEEDDAE
ncbi:hypothetical protein [Haloferax larsenii]|uniref:hypothetical protein n=1 Tax=Haloferax larsenii TaxID=302484 RepID=UPI001113B892|nr:hypothetical protein [Haloferax larsenii]